MLKEKIAQLPLEQLIQMIKLPYYLVSPLDSVTSTPEDWLCAFAMYLSEKTTWNSVVLSKMEENKKIEALQVAAIAEQQEFALSIEITQKLSDCWKEVVDDFNNRKTNIQKMLNGLSREAIEAAQYAKEVLEEMDSLELPAYKKGSTEIVDAFKKMDDKIRQREIYCKEICELAEEEIYALKEKVYELAHSSWTRLFDLFKKGSIGRGTHEESIFNHLPDIILSRRTDILKQISDCNIPLESIKLPENNMIKPVRRVYSKISMQANKEPASSIMQDQNKELDIDLSPYSEATYQSIHVLNMKLTSIIEFEHLKKKAANLISFSEKYQLWLGCAQNCNVSKLKSGAIGEGLLACGLEQIKLKKYLIARKLLVDALTCFVASGNCGELSIEPTVHATLVAWIWPLYGETKGSDEDGIVWFHEPELMLTLFGKNRFLDVVAKIWVDELKHDEVAEHFLTVVRVLIGDDRTLNQCLCERLLTPNYLIRHPDMLVHRLKNLLEDANPTETLISILDQLNTEIIFEQGSKLSLSSRHILKDIVNNLQTELEKLPKESVAPIYEVKTLLPLLIEKIISVQSKDKSLDHPHLTMQPMVHILYPDERSEDIEFPVVVRNSENASLATDVFLTIEFEIDKQKTKLIDVSSNKIEIGDLHPGQLFEAVFVIDVPDDLAKNYTELSYSLGIRISHVVENPKKFTVKIHPANRKHKNSPYTTGSAVTGANFIGREIEKQRLKSALTGDADQRALFIYGIRRIGKTSLLKYTINDVDILKHYYTVYWDVEDYSLSRSASDFFVDLVEKIVKVIPPKKQTLLGFRRNEFRDRPYRAFENFVQALDEIELPKRILIVIDEFDKLLHLIKMTKRRQDKEGQILDPSKSFQPEVFGTLRKALLGYRSISFIFVGLPNIVKQEYQSRLFGLADLIEVKAFQEDEAVQIINAGSNVMRVDPVPRKKILEATGNQPYLLQVFCNELFHRMKFSGRDTVALFDVRDVIENLLSKEDYFMDYISLLKENVEILYGLALAQYAVSGRREFVSTLEIKEALIREGFRFEENEIITALENYLKDSSMERPFISKDSRKGRNRFKFMINLIGEYLIRKGGNL